jgi:dCTP deaminase
MERGAFVLATTFERIRLPNHLAARVEGKSSLARLGISVHFTAPKIDPGWQGPITLELYNLGAFVVELKPKMEICALIIERLGKPARQGYTGRFGSGSQI